MDVDLYLLDRFFEPIALRLHERLRIGNYTLAKWFFYAGTALFVVTGIAAELRNQGGLLALVEFIYAWPGVNTACRLEREWKGDSLPPNFREAHQGSLGYGIMWRRKRSLQIALIAPVTFWLIDKLILPLLPPSLLPYDIGFYGAYGVSWALVLAGYYFLSCTPRPPKKREAKLPKSLALKPVRS